VAGHKRVARERALQAPRLTAAIGISARNFFAGESCAISLQLQSWLGTAAPNPSLPWKLVEMAVIASDDESSRHGVRFLASRRAGCTQALGPARIVLESTGPVEAFAFRTQ
jgi:hypothetical protein